jgi:hypothetical protein
LDRRWRVRGRRDVRAVGYVAKVKVEGGQLEARSFRSAIGLGGHFGDGGSSAVEWENDSWDGLGAAIVVVEWQGVGDVLERCSGEREILAGRRIGMRSEKSRYSAQEVRRASTTNARPRPRAKMRRKREEIGVNVLAESSVEERSRATRLWGKPGQMEAAQACTCR